MILRFSDLYNLEEKPKTGVNAEKPVTVRLEDDSGNLVSGRVLNVQVGNDLITRVRRTVGAMFMAGAAIVVMSPIIPFAGSLLGF